MMEYELRIYTNSYQSDFIRNYSRLIRNSYSIFYS